MAKLKLFVSHSSKTEANIRLLKKVCTNLHNRALTNSSKTIKIVYDQDGTIIGGDEWYSKIDLWMQQANAAVILFSKAALFDSDWVKKETSILTWRNNLDPNFVLIPVFLDGLDPKEFDKGLYGVLKINKRQGIQCANNAAEICNHIVDVLSIKDSVLNTRSKSFSGCSYEPLEGLLAKTISEHDHDAIEEAISTLDLDLPDWSPNEIKSNALAAARFVLEHPMSSMHNLIEFLDIVEPKISIEKTERLIKYIRSLWVDHNAAAGILNAWLKQGVIGLNGQYVELYTAKRYCERAWPLSKRWTLITVNSSHTSIEDLQADIDSALVPGDKNASNQRIHRRIKNSTNVFIILIQLHSISENTDGSLLSQLKTRYKGAVILIDLGSGQYDWLSSSNIEILSPPVEFEIEQQQFDVLEDAQNFLN